MASSEDEMMDNVADEVEDLFDDDDDDAEEPGRQLSDRELDSGDDEGRRDRAPKGDEVEDDSGREARVLETTVWRHPLPHPADGEVRSSRLGEMPNLTLL
jgi:RNA polymerase-associated protein LEO1